MNLSAENIGAIRDLARSGYPLKSRDAKGLLGHNDHLVELLEARGRLMLGIEIERDQLRAEVAGLKTGYEAYERVNDELKAEYEVARMRIKEMDLLFGRYILAMRSALIEEEHGKGSAAAMEWIYNSLAGPGELPPEGETDSQAYFDREIVAVDNGMQEVMEFHEGRRAALGQGDRGGQSTSKTSQSADPEGSKGGGQ